MKSRPETIERCGECDGCDAKAVIVAGVVMTCIGLVFIAAAIGLAFADSYFSFIPGAIGCVLAFGGLGSFLYLASKKLCVTNV